jgi:phosphotransferase system HPr (HPr) family protein
MRMLGDTNTHPRKPIESTGQVKVRAPYGLSATVARSLVETARSFRASTTLTAFDGRGRGHRADGRNLLELLLLGAVRGEAVTLECVGDDAPAAYQAIAAVLEEGRGFEEVEP